MQPVEKLVMMANQIARNLPVRGEEAAIAATADHIRRFWDPRMRASILAYLADGGDAGADRGGGGAAARAAGIAWLNWASGAGGEFHSC